MTTTGKVILTIFIILIILLLAIIGATAYFGYVYYQEYQERPQVSDGSIEWETSSTMEKFTDKEFEEYKTVSKTASKESNSFIDDIGLGDASGDVLFDAVESSEEPKVAASPEGLGSAAGDETITNVQEQGVDEGDIVKSYGDYLVVLRRGRLFSIRLKENGQDLLKPVFKSEAYPAGSTLGTYYDEMLISDDNIIVIGYSYSQSATEIGLFKIDDQGIITHQNTYFMDSNDYYSSRNYASRLVDGQLIFYMPLSLYRYDYYSDDYTYDAHMPQVRKWIKGSEVGPGKEILKPENIYKPVQSVDNTTPTLHTVVSCDVESADFNCNSQAILGPYARNFYVSPDNVYIWVSDYDYYYYDDVEARDNKDPNAFAYAMPLDLSDAKAVQTYGTPLDQFSFKEKDGTLNVLVRDEGYGDVMWSSEYSDSDLSFVSIPLSDFSKNLKTVDLKKFKGLPTPDSYTLQNRYVGDYLLYGSGSSWWDDNFAGDKVYLFDFTDPKSDVQYLDLDSTVDRIEVLDNNNAVVVGTNDEDLQFNWIALSEDATLDNTHLIPNASQGETRSHGFSYSPDEGILGLPIRQGEGYEQLWEHSSKVEFLGVDMNNHTFNDLGALEATPTEDRDVYADVLDDCEYSCTDWYGNSRPIFYLDRIFALMGYDLVEGEVQNGAMKEIRSADYLEVQ